LTAKEPVKGKGLSEGTDKPPRPLYQSGQNIYVNVRCKDDHITDCNVTSMGKITKFCLNGIDKRNQKTPAWLQGHGFKVKPDGGRRATGSTKGCNDFTILTDICQVKACNIAVSCTYPIRRFTFKEVKRIA